MRPSRRLRLTQPLAVVESPPPPNQTPPTLRKKGEGGEEDAPRTSHQEGDSVGPLALSCLAPIQPVKHVLLPASSIAYLPIIRANLSTTHT